MMCMATIVDSDYTICCSLTISDVIRHLPLPHTNVALLEKLHLTTEEWLTQPQSGVAQNLEKLHLTTE